MPPIMADLDPLTLSLVRRLSNMVDGLFIDEVYYGQKDVDSQGHGKEALSLTA